MRGAGKGGIGSIVFNIESLGKKIVLLGSAGQEWLGLGRLRKFVVEEGQVLILKE